MNRHVLKILCLLAAIVIWTQVAANRTMIREAELALHVVGVPEGFTLAGSEWNPRVKVRAAGSKWQFFRHRLFGAELGEVVVDVSSLDRGVLVVRDVTANDVRTDLEDVSLASTVTLRLFIDRLDSLRVPVQIDAVGSPGEERMLLSPLRAVPDSVSIFGPSRLLGDLSGVRTDSVDLARIRENGDFVRRLRSPGPNLTLGVEEVSVVAEVAERGSRLFEHVPLVPLLDSGQPHAEVFPPVASVEISGPVDVLTAMTAADLSLTVSSTGLGPGAHTVRPTALLPEHCTLLTIEPLEYMLVVGGSESNR